MSKLIYFLIPLGIILAAIILVNTFSNPEEEELKHLSEHLRVISNEPPEYLTFCGEPVPLGNPDVFNRLERELRRFVTYHQSTSLMVKRAHRYRESFQQILLDNEIPGDFFYLAMAESGLANRTSPVGAKGFWQFMESTAKLYGLRVDGSVDERYHPEKATAAACKYFKDSYDEFCNWTLVAASYNMGIYGLMRAIRRQGFDDYYLLDLNRETSKYLYRILAYKIILEDPERYGFNLSEKQKYKPVSFRSVPVNTSIPNLHTFAAENNSSYYVIKRMNPWLVSNHLNVKKGETFRIRIPYSENVNLNELLIDAPISEFRRDSANINTDTLQSVTIGSDSVIRKEIQSDTAVSTDSEGPEKVADKTEKTQDQTD